MVRNASLGTYKTEVKADSRRGIIVTYDGLDIVSANDERVILNHNGRMTRGVFNRLNEASRQYQLCYRVERYAGGWVVRYRGESHKFGRSGRVRLKGRNYYGRNRKGA